MILVTTFENNSNTSGTALDNPDLDAISSFYLIDLRVHCPRRSINWYIIMNQIRWSWVKSVSHESFIHIASII